ncbi:hypothetical protein [Pseudomonas fluorescens]|uniref:hypothetical protein n=1 Tax=Pseudomonas fluorescens TaxID=294 RepID=UPI0005FBA951|nr:hypothetical protein [Pseudomonas fluorescens]KJZ40014.1 hypothetical protein VC33_04630 [Pseudomonas fluorescens]
MKTINGTSGSFTANTTDSSLPVYEGDSDRMMFFRDLDLGWWTLSSRATITDGDPDYRDILIFFPDEGSVSNKTYNIVFDQTSGKASAAWVVSTDNTFNPYPAQLGEVTVTLDAEKNSVSGTFHFHTQSLGGIDFKVSDGKFALEGLEEKRSIPKRLSEGHFTADITGGPPETQNYQATRVKLTHLPTSIYFKPAHWHGWSQQEVTGQPGQLAVFVQVLIADTAKPGESYQLSEDSEVVRATCIVTQGNVKNFQAISGSLKLDSSPPKESSAGTLKGSVDFVARSGDGTTITIDNGKFSITN